MYTLAKVAICFTLAISPWFNWVVIVSSWSCINFIDWQLFEFHEPLILFLLLSIRDLLLQEYSSHAIRLCTCVCMGGVNSRDGRLSNIYTSVYKPVWLGYALILSVSLCVVVCMQWDWLTRPPMSQDCWSSRTGQLETTSVRNCQRGREWWCNKINVHTHSHVHTRIHAHTHTHTRTHTLYIVHTRYTCTYTHNVCLHVVTIDRVQMSLLICFSDCVSDMRISPMPCLCRTTPEEMANTTWLPVSPASLSSLTWAQRCTMPMVRLCNCSFLIVQAMKPWSKFSITKIL